MRGLGRAQKQFARGSLPGGGGSDGLPKIVAWEVCRQATAQAAGEAIECNWPTCDEQLFPSPGATVQRQLWGSAGHWHDGI